MHPGVVRPPLAAKLALILGVACGALSGGIACSSADAGSGQSGAPAKPKVPFLKGQLHAHSSGSMDSDTPPERVVRWYADHGFDFLVITDHNRITRAMDAPTMLVLPGVELTINLRTCEPPPPRGRNCLLHMNALLPEHAWPEDGWRPRSRTTVREEIFEIELAEALRLGAIPQIDHPNFHFAADGPLVTRLAAKGVAMMEIANEAHDSLNEGDATHDSTERMWDQALTAGARILGTATDDAHDYFEDDQAAEAFPKAYTGDRGFVMVRAERSARSIREALVRGDFYASTGLLLGRCDVAPDRIALETASGEPVWFEVIGEHGGVHRAEAGRAIAFDPRSIPSSYVRVRVTDPEGRHAWTQPVWRLTAP